ncbi:MAG: prepilin-type N-terminal cleavage/methylation domain-containing protein [Planctomycetota bacterium]|nr:prepilin-type N-terminal cleavage/methylation domain-containing protein [Planctomycetota bacterium]
MVVSRPSSRGYNTGAFTLIEVTVTLVLITIMAGVIVSVLLALGDTIVAGRAKAKAVHHNAQIVHKIRSEILFSRIKDDGGTKRSDLTGSSCPDRNKGGPPGHEKLWFQKVTGYEEDPPASGTYVPVWSNKIEYKFVDAPGGKDYPGYIVREWDKNGDGSIDPVLAEGETQYLGGYPEGKEGNTVLDCCFDIDVLNDQFIISLKTRAGDDRRKPPTDFTIENEIRVKPIN